MCFIKKHYGFVAYWNQGKSKNPDFYLYTKKEFLRYSVRETAIERKNEKVRQRERRG